MPYLPPCARPDAPFLLWSSNPAESASSLWMLPSAPAASTPPSLPAHSVMRYPLSLEVSPSSGLAMASLAVCGPPTELLGPSRCAIFIISHIVTNTNLMSNHIEFAMLGWDRIRQPTSLSCCPGEMGERKCSGRVTGNPVELSPQIFCRFEERSLTPRLVGVAGGIPGADYSFPSKS